MAAGAARRGAVLLTGMAKLGLLPLTHNSCKNELFTILKIMLYESIGNMAVEPQRCAGAPSTRRRQAVAMPIGATALQLSKRRETVGR
jgi:hypothetical protein